MFSQPNRVAVLLFVPLLFACGGGRETAETPAEGDTPEAAEATGTAPDLSQAGTVTGKVSFEGDEPRRARIRMGAEPACDSKHGGNVFSEVVVVNQNGTLQHAFVWIKSGLEEYRFDTPSEPVVLDQDGCLYSPHVFGVQTRQEIKVVNSDPVTHNIHPVPRQNREWNISQSPNQELLRAFPREEIMIPVKCNVHPWMTCYAGVVGHPYFSVTGDDGTFELRNVPPGDYTIEVWHERFGTQEQQVTVGPSESKEIEFTYSG